MAGPWGTGPYKLVEGSSTPDKRSDRVVLEVNLEYWDPSRYPRLQRIIFDNDAVLQTIDREQQQTLIRQMELHTHEQAYFLFLYSPIKLYAVNKSVTFVPYVTGNLLFAETSVTEQHWSVRKQKAGTPE
jgi:ABC-type transport system substrate-binding protein